MSKFQVYFRSNADTRDEYRECSRSFNTVPARTMLEQSGGTVICRYSALPFNRELEQDLHVMGLQPINTADQHSYIANMDWLDTLGEITFPTWTRLIDIPGDFPLVVKGRTNSRKFEWSTRMYAPTRRRAAEIAADLYNDPVIGSQGIVFRKYIPLRTFEIGINDMPMTNEWRCFFYKNILVDADFYWSIVDDLNVVDRNLFLREGLPLAQRAANLLCEHADFFVVDVAQGADGQWWVVEVNDAQMSGLSLIPETRFYANLKQVLETHG